MQREDEERRGDEISELDQALGHGRGPSAGFFSLFWPFPPVYLWYAIEASPVLPFFFYQCPTPVYAGPIPYTLPIADFERDVTAFLPFAGPFPVPPLFTFD